MINQDWSQLPDTTTFDLIPGNAIEFTSEVDFDNLAFDLFARDVTAGGLAVEIPNPVNANSFFFAGPSAPTLTDGNTYGVDVGLAFRNGLGKVDQILLSVPGATVDGDYNNNGLVEQGDFDLVLLNWGDSWPPEIAGWVNQQPTDGMIDQNDLDGVLLNWGNSAAVAAAPVPEPASLVLLAGIVIFGGACRHARRLV